MNRYTLTRLVPLGLLCLSLLALTSCDSSGGNDNGGEEPPPAQPDVSVLRITEVNEQDGWVELINTGNETVDVSEAWLCANRVYERLNALTVAAGDLMLDSGERVAVESAQIDANDGDLAIYLSDTESPAGFGNADQIVDYLRWGDGAGDTGRQSTAVDAGIWTEGDAVSAAADGATISFLGDSPRSNDTVADWGDGEPTPGEANAPFEGGGQTNNQSNVRITEVNEQDGWVELINTGSDTVDVSDTWLCANRQYVRAESQDVTVTFDDAGNGDFILDAGERIALGWNQIDADNGDFGLYLSGTANPNGFGNADQIVDYLRWGDGAGDTGRQSTAVDAGIWTQGDAVSAAAVGATISFFGDDPASNDTVADWGDGEPTPGEANVPFENNQSNVRITEVNEQDGWVELINTGSETVDVSEAWLCANRVYERLSNLTLAAGDLMLDSGERVAIEWDQIDADNGDFALYLSGTANPDGFGNADQIVDYLRWGNGAGDTGRQSTAVDAGIWMQGDAVAAAADGATISFFGDDPASNDTVADWGDGEPTPGEANSELGSASLSDIRITEVSESGQWVEIVNTGNGPLDVSVSKLCANFVYPAIGDSEPTVEAFDANGDEDLTLAAGEYLAVNWGQIDADNGDLALYEANTNNFGNSDNIIDYVRWGSDDAEADREDVAVDAGIWTETDFVSPAASGMTFSFVGSDPRSNDNVADWEETDPTPAAPNSASNSSSLSRF